jgi:hypothetical protein
MSTYNLAWLIGPKDLLNTTFISPKSQVIKNYDFDEKKSTNNLYYFKDKSDW